MNSYRISWLKVSISLLLVVFLIVAYWWVQSKTGYFISGWSSIVLGAILLVFGSFVLADQEWSLLGLVSKSGRKATCLIFAIVIAIGGTLTTKGWNQLDNHEQKKALIEAVFRELSLNERQLKDHVLFVKTDEETLKSRLLYPRLYTTSLSAILRSSLFKPTKNSKDDMLLTTIRDYEDCVRDFNARLQVMDNFVASTKDVNVVEAHRRNLIQSRGFKQMCEEHNKVIEFFRNNYSWAID
jgi:hypothetical protein